MENINIEDFAKVVIKVGIIKAADIVPDADKLIRFDVDLGEEVVQILSGVREHYPDPSVLVGKQVPVVVNLPPRKLRGLESQGMILYAVGEGENFTTIETTKPVSAGTIIR